MRGLLLAAVVTFGTPKRAEGVSNGHTFECNPSGNFGCSTWEKGDRMKCQEEGPDGSKGKRGYMHWVERPKHTDKYTLRAGKSADVRDDSTHYVPGAMLSLWITTTDYDWKYKGFFARAVDDNGYAVGEWQFPGNSEQKFWSPPECGRSHVIHRDASLKPLQSQLFFKAPVAGTGTITFHALIKRGEPNVGSFWYPNLKAADGTGGSNNEEEGMSGSKLVLREATEEESPMLVPAPEGVSCASFCGGLGQVCDADTMRSSEAASGSGLLKMVGPTTAEDGASTGVMTTPTLCRPPILQSCSAVAPAIKPATGECWYYRNDGNCKDIINNKPGAVTDLTGLAGCTAAAAADDDGSDDRNVCEVVAAETGLQRLCACKEAGRRRNNRMDAADAFAAVDDPSLSAADTSTAAASSAAAAALYRSSSANNNMATTTTTAVAVAVAAIVAGHRNAALSAMLAVLVALPSPTAAHNWMHTPSRSRLKASTEIPCIPRKASDTHQQVGPGQSFMIKWATGHAADGSLRCLHPIKDVADPKCIPIGKEYTAIAIVHEDDYNWLKHEDFQEMFEEYVVHAPEAQRNNHLDPHWARYHGVDAGNCGNCDGLGEDKGGLDGFVQFANMTRPPEPPRGSEFHVAGRDAFAFPKSKATQHATHVDLGVRDAESKEPLVLQRIENTSKDWLDQIFGRGGAGGGGGNGGSADAISHLYRYTDEGMKNDRRISYDSEKYPWLLMAGVYPHIFQRPSDFDALRVEIPLMVGKRKMKAGHYIVHYRWKGYGDCTDVNVHDTQMDNVDGVDEDRYIWNKVDHCSYQQPEEISTQCHISSGSPDECVKELTGRRDEKSCGTNCATRYGVNVVPMKLPSAVMFPDLATIPWVNETCANNDWTKMHGTVTRNEKVDWSKWEKVEVPNKKCSAKGSYIGRFNNMQMTLRQAVLHCTDVNCGGISYKLTYDDDGNQIPVETGSHFFNVCSRGGRTGSMTLNYSKEYMTLQKAAAVDEPLINPTPTSSQSTIGVVFAAPLVSGIPVNPTYQAVDVTWGRDTGGVYGFHSDSGLTYGWHCPLAESYDADKLTMHSEGRQATLQFFKDKKQPCFGKGGANNVAVECAEGGWYTDERMPANDVSSDQFYLKKADEIKECKDGVQNYWEMKVEPGVYELDAVVGYPAKSSGTSHFEQGCAVENMRLYKHYRSYGQFSVVVHVEVMDGKFTFQGIKGGSFQKCSVINSFKLTRVADRLQIPWYPVVPTAKWAGTWWQIKLDNPTTPVGLVTIRPNGKNSDLDIDCRVWWMFSDFRCNEMPPLGRFRNSGKTAGMVVSVSNTPCQGNKCEPQGQHVCGSGEGSATASVEFAPFSDPASFQQSPNKYLSHQLNCNGHSGAYLRVWLPGPNRIFDGTVTVNRNKPVVPSADEDKPCAVKTMLGKPGGYGTAKQTVQSNNCDGAGNKNSDSTCCHPSMAGLPNSKELGVRCCATHNPYKPKCSSGNVVNVAHGVSGHMTQDMATLYVDSNQKRMTPWKIFQDKKKPAYLGGTAPEPQYEAKQHLHFLCDGDCAILIDLEGKYDITSIDWWGYSWKKDDAGKYSIFAPDATPLANHHFYAWNGDDDDATATTTPLKDTQRAALLFESDHSDSSKWTSLGGKEGDANSGTYVFDVVRARFVKMHITGNNIKGHKWARLAEVQIFGCDSAESKQLVPELRGASGDDLNYVYGQNSYNALKTPFSKYGWMLMQYRQLQLQTPWNPRCTTAWAASDIKGKFTYNDAVQACSDIGGEVCSVEQLTQGCGTYGGFHDSSEVWTKDECSNELSGVCDATQDDALICYGVEAREAADSSTPEFVIVDDPLDPIFYSTCYVREKAISFEPPQGSSEVTAQGSFGGDGNESTVYNGGIDSSNSGALDWQFNGECLTCSNLEDNKAGGAAPPRWAIKGMDDCYDCTAGKDLTAAKCDATIAATTPAPKEVVPCFVDSDVQCDANLAIQGGVDCLAAVKAAFPGLFILGVDEVTTGDSLPAGCSARLVAGEVQGYFNTDASATTTSCAGNVAESHSGFLDASSINSKIEVKMMPEVGKVAVTMTGPAEGWFGFGFNAFRMADQPYTLVVEPQSKHLVSEWLLGGHSRGILLEKDALRTWNEGVKYRVVKGCVDNTQGRPEGSMWAEGWFPPEHTAMVQCCSVYDPDDEYAGSESEFEASCSRKEAPFNYKSRCVHGDYNANDGSTMDEKNANIPTDYASAVEVCAANGRRLCTAEELQSESSLGCCSGGCGGDGKSVWAADMYTPPDPRVEIESHSTFTDGETGESQMKIKVILDMVATDDNRFTFDVSKYNQIPMVGAKGPTPDGEWFVGDCSNGDFGCYHNPLNKLNLPLPIFEDKSVCVCKQACTTSTTTTTATTATTPTTTTTSQAADGLTSTTTITTAKKATVLNFDGAAAGNTASLSDAEKEEALEEFANAVEQELADNLGIDVEDLNGTATVTVQQEEDGSVTAIVAWEEDAVDAADGLQHLNVTINGQSYGSTELLPDQSGGEGDGDAAVRGGGSGTVIGGAVGGALVVLVLIAVAVVVVMRKKSENAEGAGRGSGSYAQGGAAAVQGGGRGGPAPAGFGHSQRGGGGGGGGGGGSGRGGRGGRIAKTPPHHHSGASHVNPAYTSRPLQAAENSDI